MTDEKKQEECGCIFSKFFGWLGRLFKCEGHDSGCGCGGKCEIKEEEKRDK